MLHGGKYSPETEKFVAAVRDAIIRLAVGKGFDVIIDDTNFHPKHQEDLQKLANELGAQPKIIFVDTPVEDCIRRDKNRDGSVGEEVIRRMYERYKNQFPPA